MAAIILLDCELSANLFPEPSLIIRFRIEASLPLPARTVLGAVQIALKTKRSVAEQVIHEGGVTCRGRLLCQGHHRLQIGDQLEIDYAPQPMKSSKCLSASAANRFEIVHDDSSFIVVNKPAGLLTVPTPKRESNTLQSQLRKWLSRQQPGAHALCVHRLDRLVSGLLVFAKTFEAADAIRDQFASRKPERCYTAFVAGQMKTSQGTIRSYLSTNEQLSRLSSEDPTAGELAITHYRVIEQWRDVALIEVRLETGRRNQIRVHLAEQGHPILGDPRYRPQEAAHPAWAHQRVALHAETLEIQHPETKKVMRFVASWPQEFRNLRKQLTRSHR